MKNENTISEVEKRIKNNKILVFLLSFLFAAAAIAFVGAMIAVVIGALFVVLFIAVLMGKSNNANDITDFFADVIKAIVLNAIARIILIIGVLYVLCGYIIPKKCLKKGNIKGYKISIMIVYAVGICVGSICVIGSNFELYILLYGAMKIVLGIMGIVNTIKIEG